MAPTYRTPVTALSLESTGAPLSLPFPLYILFSLMDCVTFSSLSLPPSPPLTLSRPSASLTLSDPHTLSPSVISSLSALESRSTLSLPIISLPPSPLH